MGYHGLEVSGFGLIQPEIKSDPICAGLDWVRIHFLIQVGLDLGSGLGSLLIWSQIWIRVWVHFLLQVGLDFGSEKSHGFEFGFGFIS